jgi:glucose/arabinose dehydrogenase
MPAKKSHCDSGARALCVAVALIASACGGSSSSPSAPSTEPPPPSSGPINVTGTERIGWDQPADDASQLAHYQYLGYVDDAPQVLASPVCGTTPSNGAFPCDAKLPTMSFGNHRLELAAQEIDGAQRLGPRSAAILLNVTSRTSVVASGATPQIVSTHDGIQLMVETLMTGLSAPSAVAVAPDGRVFVARRDGAIVVWQNGRIVPSPALQLSDAAQTSDIGLIDLAFDPQFASNGLAFVAYTARDQSGWFVHRVMRVRDVNGVISKPAVILEERALLAPLRPPRIRVAADHTVYVALPPTNQSTAESYASYTGKMLRINQDGSTPRDNPAATPVLSSGEAVTGGFDWHPATGRLWLAGRDWKGHDFLEDFQLGPRGAATFEAPVDPSGAAFYRQRRIAGFANDLFIAALNGRHLRRVHFSQRDPNSVEITEHLFDGQYGRISDVAVGPDGAIYFCTSNAGTTSAAAGGDRLLRLTASN